MKVLRSLWEQMKTTPKWKLFPILYFLLLILGFLLSFLSLFIPSLIQCTSPFGGRVCAPLGMFVLIAVNVPGYLTVGFFKAFTKGSEIPEIASMLLVAGISILFYYGVGVFADRKIYKRLSFSNTPVVIAIVSFCLLAVLFVYLFRLSKMWL